MIYIDILYSAYKLNLELKSLPGILNSTNNATEKNTSDLFDELITHKRLNKTIKKLYKDGHHARAVEEAYKFLDNMVKKTSGINESGAKLMQSVFSAGNPVLMLNAGSSTSEQDEQKGYMQIFSGCMTGIRNPRAHECDWEDSENHALQLLAFANYLVERVENSKKSHNNRQKTSDLF